MRHATAAIRRNLPNKAEAISTLTEASASLDPWLAGDRILVGGVMQLTRTAAQSACSCKPASGRFRDARVATSRGF